MDNPVSWFLLLILACYLISRLVHKGLEELEARRVENEIFSLDRT